MLNIFVFQIQFFRERPLVLGGTVHSLFPPHQEFFQITIGTKIKNCSCHLFFIIIIILPNQYFDLRTVVDYKEQYSPNFDSNSQDKSSYTICEIA